MKKKLKYLSEPKKIILHLMNKGFFKSLSDEKYLSYKYYLVTGDKLNLDNPRTFNEKLQWLKIHNRKDIYTIMVDKAEAKRFVAGIIGKQHVVPTIGVFDRFDDIDFEELPNQFVMKCTHDSGGIVICKDKSKLDTEAIRKKINKFLKRKYYYIHREWPYKNVRPRIIIEEYLEDKKCKSMRDYKIFCFNGKPELVYVSDDSHTDKQRMAFFDSEYRFLPIERTDYTSYTDLPPKPKNFQKMKDFSAILSSGIPHLRVDWYEIDGKLYFSEFTFYTGAGYIPFKDEKWDEKLGQLIDLGLVRK